MLSNPSPDSVTANSTPSAPPASKSAPGAELPLGNAESSAGETITPGSAPLLPAAIADSPSSGLQTQIQKLKSEVPEIGVLGQTETLSDAEYVQLLTYEEVVGMANTSWFEAGRAPLALT